MDDNAYSHSIDKTIRYRTDDAVYQVHEYNLDLKANHIYLMGEPQYIVGAGVDETAEPGVEFSMANRFIKNLNVLMRKSGDPILIHMKTCGGDFSEGMAIFDAIKACPNEVAILSYTHARSMSSIIFCAAERRIMMPHSTFMIHQGATGFEGTYKQFQTAAAQDSLYNDQMLNVYIDTLRKAGSMKKWSRKRIREFLTIQMEKKEEVYFSATQAVKLGFADAVFGADGTWDWSSLLAFDK